MDPTHAASASVSAVSATAAPAKDLAFAPYWGLFNAVTEYGVLAFIGVVTAIGVVGLLLYLGYQWVKSNPFAKKAKGDKGDETPTDRMLRKVEAKLSDRFMPPPPSTNLDPAIQQALHGSTTHIQPAVMGNSGSRAAMRTPLPGTIMSPTLDPDDYPSFTNHSLFRDLEAARTIRIHNLEHTDEGRLQLARDAVSTLLEVYQQCIHAFVVELEADIVQSLRVHPDPAMPGKAAGVISDIYARTADGWRRGKIPPVACRLLERQLMSYIEQLSGCASSSVGSLMHRTNRERLGAFVSYCHASFFFIYAGMVEAALGLNGELTGEVYKGFTLGGGATDHQPATTAVPQTALARK